MCLSNQAAEVYEFGNVSQRLTCIVFVLARMMSSVRTACMLTPLTMLWRLCFRLE